MPSKGMVTAGVKMSPEEKAAIAGAAKAAGLSLSAYLRKCHRAASSTAQQEPIAAAPSLSVYHVDELGPDTLRAGEGSLVR